MDSGELIVQGALPIENFDTVESLSSKIHKLEHIVLPLAISQAGKLIRNDLKDKNL